jgi:hypothetical protein
MKNTLLIIALFLCGSQLLAQEITTDSTSSEIYVVTKNDGTKFIGVIVKNDAREVLIKTQEKGDVYIPKHEIKSIDKLKAEDFKKGKYIGENPLSSRYIFTTNGLGLKKNESYLKVNIIGMIDFEMGITDKISAGIMSSFYGMPVVGNVKYSFNLADNINSSVGVIYGNTTWLSSSFFDKPFRIGGGIVFGNVTFGDRKKNLNFSGGYGFVHYPEKQYQTQTITDPWGYTYTEYIYTGTIQKTAGTALFSVGGMTQVSEKATLLFDSVIAYEEGDVFYAVAPAVRYAASSTNIWQFGLSMVGLNETILPIPLPLVSYHKKL